MTVITDHLFDQFCAISGSEHVFRFNETISYYGSDETVTYNYPFELLIRPSNTDEISKILSISNEYKIPITPRGGGSGVSGGALPVKGGIVLSTERLNKIISIDKSEGYVITESGVVTKTLCDFVESNGFYFPVSPTSGPSSFIGGNVSENAGSINSCRFGKIAQYVINLEVVLGNGAIIWTGANVQKNSTGLNLTQLFVGGEGLLGIITKIVIRLIPLEVIKYETNLLCAFNDLQNATDLLICLKMLPFLFSSAELIGRGALDITAKFLDEPLPLVESSIQAHLILKIQSHSKIALDEMLEETYKTIELFAPAEVLVATSAKEIEKLWKIRFNIGSALSAREQKYRDVDACIPIEMLYNYLRHAEQICKKHHILSVYFGHAIEGNLHIMLLIDDHIQGYSSKMDLALDEIYSFVIQIGGTISGEHGIGMLQKKFMSLQFNEDQLTLMNNIKNIFDPNSILNPGKVFIEEK